MSWRKILPLPTWNSPLLLSISGKKDHSSWEPTSVCPAALCLRGLSLADCKRQIENNGGSEKIEIVFFFPLYKISIKQLWQSRAEMAVPQSWQGPQFLLAHHSITSKLAISASWTMLVASAPAFISVFQTVVWERENTEGSLLYFRQSSWKSNTFLFESDWSKLVTWPQPSCKKY